VSNQTQKVGYNNSGDKHASLLKNEFRDRFLLPHFENSIFISLPGDTIVMKDQFIAKASITISAPASRVWEALTQPELIQQYLFGTQVTTDWNVGSAITYRGEWEGKAYEDKGEILQIEPEKLFVSTYWSAFSGLPDVPENYKTVRYELTGSADNTILTVTQDNNASQAEAEHSQQNWITVLQGLKKLLEEEKASY
jgi:uncharacterized protein YndB with AHSA1/START domain